MSNKNKCNCLACAMRALFAERYPSGTHGMSEDDRDKILVVAAELAGVTLSAHPDEDLRDFIAAVMGTRERARAEDRARLN